MGLLTSNNNQFFQNNLYSTDRPSTSLIPTNSYYKPYTTTPIQGEKLKEFLADLSLQLQSLSEIYGLITRSQHNKSLVLGLIAAKVGYVEYFVKAYTEIINLSLPEATKEITSNAKTLLTICEHKTSQNLSLEEKACLAHLSLNLHDISKGLKKSLKPKMISTDSHYNKMLAYLDTMKQFLECIEIEMSYGYEPASFPASLS